PVVLHDMNALADDYRQHDANLLRLNDEVDAVGQLVKVKQAEGLPKMHVGYQRNTSTGEALNGVVGGVSIPLFANRGRVKSARAEQTSRSLQLQDKQMQLQSEVLALYNRKEQLAKVLAEFDVSLPGNQIELLGKALELGELTIMDYLTEVNQVLDVQQQYAKVEQEYQQICYRLIRYRL
ncbi:MAG: TolC family protein, partial [Bacteroidaceae bacterium]|nr:TolC family protein [Bacteroidaceae bacterium]